MVKSFVRIPSDTKYLIAKEVKINKLIDKIIIVVTMKINKIDVKWSLNDDRDSIVCDV